jgi:sialidase-1
MKPLLCLSLLLAAALPPARSADAPQRQDLFAANAIYLTCRIPGMVVTSKGSVLAYCEGRRGSRGDWADIDLLYRRSADGGHTWSPTRILVRLPEPQPRNPRRVTLVPEMGGSVLDARTYHNCIMIPDRDTGAIHCLFCVDYWRCFYMRSDDDGVSFSTPREITDVIARYRRKGVAWRVVGDGCGHGIQLGSGRLVEALWLSDSSQAHGGGHRPGNVGVIYSDDHGATWNIGDWVIRNSAEFPNPSETCAVELSDGRVLFNTRVESERYRRVVTLTNDVAGPWGQPHYDEHLFGPWCEASLLRISGPSDPGGTRILFCNPDSERFPASAQGGIGGKSRPRRNLTLRLSYDDGRTWPVSKVIDPGVAGYNDLTMLPDHTLLCLYERGSTTGSQTANAALTLERFDLGWLTGGKDRF